MEYQKKTKNWVEINEESSGTYNNTQIKFKTTMLKSSLYDYSDEYVLVKGNITVDNIDAAGVAANYTNKKVIFKDCALFTDCIRKINNTQLDNTKYIDMVMSMCSLIEHSDNYSKKLGSLRQYYNDTPAVDDDGYIVDFDGANATDSFNFKAKIIGKTDDDEKTNNVKIMVPLKHLSNFCRTLEMPSINFEVNLILDWSANCYYVY